MKKLLFVIFIIITRILFSKENISEEDTRKYNQSLEEKVFELEKEDEKSIKEYEAFVLGKRRLEDLRNNEEKLLRLEKKYGIDRNREIAELEEKYKKVLDKYSELKNERELLNYENKEYEEQLRRISELEKGL